MDGYSIMWSPGDVTSSGFTITNGVVVAWWINGTPVSRDEFERQFPPPRRSPFYRDPFRADS